MLSKKPKLMLRLLLPMLEYIAWNISQGRTKYQSTLNKIFVKVDMLKFQCW